MLDWLLKLLLSYRKSSRWCCCLSAWLRVSKTLTPTPLSGERFDQPFSERKWKRFVHLLYQLYTPHLSLSHAEVTECNCVLYWSKNLDLTLSYVCARVPGGCWRCAASWRKCWPTCWQTLRWTWRRKSWSPSTSSVRWNWLLSKTNLTNNFCRFDHNCAAFKNLWLITMEIPKKKRCRVKFKPINTYFIDSRTWKIFKQL